MSETIKIGKNEYDIDKPWTATTQDLQLALNELAQLRQERDDLQKRVKELEEANKVLADGLSEIGIAVADITQKESPDEN